MEIGFLSSENVEVGLRSGTVCPGTRLIISHGGALKRPVQFWELVNHEFNGVFFLTLEKGKPQITAISHLNFLEITQLSRIKYL